jgi:hypothetical protein
VQQLFYPPREKSEREKKQLDSFAAPLKGEEWTVMLMKVIIG